MTILQNLITTNNIKSGKRKYDCKLPKLNVAINYVRTSLTFFTRITK